MFIRKLLGIVAICVVIWSPAIAQAHVLETDGPIGAVLHIDPEDDPIVGQPATFYLEFKDKKGEFSLDQCDCRAIIKKSGQEVFSAALTGSPLTYTFPERSIYEFQIQGSPKQDSQFDSFRLTYELRVDRVENSASAPVKAGLGILDEHTWHIVLFGVGFIIIGLLYLKDKYKAKKVKK